MKKTSNKKGAVLLIAILVSSVALAVGLGVYERTYKELLFASFWKQTQVAFAAADAGLECAMYWDSHTAKLVGGNATCFGVTFVWNIPAPVLPANILISGGCVNVTITKGADTTIEARGYNTCDENNPRRVERGLGVRY